ncbi:lipopolysaccharide transport periplasmic protein LptA [Thiohalorhabdus denitrificans]|uniref:Lipopolysaccharide export system protein LptA n=1 Tax=Thiohalorhabdus denitrificans TaxID=381306 RepID=A0A1G5FNW1_9GAMM|nr:lipopolysaccharide transport periplasmic protein LptA [Thiohalorhabdus denitrificans]SCY40926.1 OstA-like protein [Thiohalorhabdus denitrificans]
MSPADRILPPLFLLVLAAALSPGAAAQESPSPSTAQDGPSREEPLVVESDEMTIRDADQEAIYTGNVVATRGDMVLRARRVVVSYGEEGMRTIRAFGAPVTLDQGERHGEAEEALYDAREGTVLLTGSAYLEEGPNSLEGARIRYYLDEERTEVFSGEGEENGRARGVFQPGSEPGARESREQGGAPDDE